MHDMHRRSYRVFEGVAGIRDVVPQQTAHEETVKRFIRFSLNPPIEPIDHFLLSRDRKLVGTVKNERIEPLRLADGLI